ncbi:MAG: MBL fold metallo-hydrolase, partial [Calditrichaeota bacterium]|nr:MBL fold metallo-hydrolase [Calditrichota bacterium]
MSKILILAIALVCGLISTGFAAEEFEEDVIPTSAGDLSITFIGHGTLMFTFGGKTIHVDPVALEADYTKMPQADLILVTHEHGDHLDPDVIEILRKESTDIVLS